MPIDPIEIGVIVGVGQSELIEGAAERVVQTPYGPTSEPVQVGVVEGRRVAFLSRRRPGETLQPHLVPYRANVWALASLGVKSLVTTTASSGLRDSYSPGTFVVGDQIIDLTSGRTPTFYDEGDAVQLAVPEPFDPTLRALAVESLLEQRVRYRDFGTTVVVDGPRFSTRAEAHWHAAIGGDMVNMTLMPETTLAMELGMSVVNVSFITDRGAGYAPEHADAGGLDIVRRRAAAAQPTLRRTIHELVARIPLGTRQEPAVPQARIDALLARPVVDDAALEAMFSI